MTALEKSGIHGTRYAGMSHARDPPKADQGPAGVPTPRAIVMLPINLRMDSRCEDYLPLLFLFDLG